MPPSQCPSCCAAGGLHATRWLRGRTTPRPAPVLNPALVSAALNSAFFAAGRRPRPALYFGHGRCCLHPYRQVLATNPGPGPRVPVPTAGLQFCSATFHALGARVKALADDLCGGRLVFLLEGGYDLEALGQSVANTLLGELAVRECVHMLGVGADFPPFEGLSAWAGNGQHPAGRHPLASQAACLAGLPGDCDKQSSGWPAGTRRLLLPGATANAHWLEPSRLCRLARPCRRAGRGALRLL